MRASDLLDVEGLPPVGTRVMVGVSGGVDSVVLAHLLHSSGYPLVLGHVHHGLRGDSADADQRLVEDLGRSWSVPVRVERVLVSREAGSIQAAARTARYRVLGRMAQEDECGFVVVAHHAGDQAETVLLNLARGAGTTGVGGMAPVAPLPGSAHMRLLRPLLRTSPEAIRAYAVEAGLPWREDPSNLDERYRRNALRLGVMPVLKEIFGPEVVQTLARSAEQIRNLENAEIRPLSQALLNLAGRPLDGRHLEAEGLFLETSHLGGLSETWRQRLLLDALSQVARDAPRSTSVAERLDRLRASQAGRYLVLGPVAAWRERDGLAFVTDITVPEPVLLRSSGKVQYGRYCFSLEAEPEAHLPKKNQISLREATVLEIRPWAEGDRLTTLAGTRKVKDLLTEARYPCFSRQSAPVVVSDGRVVWLPGIRADPRFLASPGSRPSQRLAFAVE